MTTPKQPHGHAHTRFRAALDAALAHADHDDAEAVGWVREVQDEYLLCQFFNGWDALESARTRRPDLVERALEYMRTRKIHER